MPQTKPDAAAPVPAPASAPAPHPPGNPGERVQAYILDKITSRVWVAHDKIPTEQEFVSLFGVSRVAVREAVGGLVARGLLTKRQGSGTFVADPAQGSCFDQLYPMILLDETNIVHLLEFRSSFECGNVRLFMARHEPDDIDVLERNFREMVAVRHADPEAAAILDFEFHRIIALGTRNPYVIRVSHILTDILKSHQKVIYQVGDPANAFEYHGEIIKYMRKSDVLVVSCLMRRHLEDAIDSIGRNQRKRRPGAGNENDSRNDVMNDSVNDLMNDSRPYSRSELCQTPS